MNVLNLRLGMDTYIMSVHSRRGCVRDTTNTMTPCINEGYFDKAYSKYFIVDTIEYFRVPNCIQKSITIFVNYK